MSLFPLYREITLPKTIVLRHSNTHKMIKSIRKLRRSINKSSLISYYMINGINAKIFLTIFIL